MKKMLSIILSAMPLLGCNPTVEQYQHETPSLNFQSYLSGSLEGQGVIQNWRGVVIKRFHFSGHAKWDGDHGTFDETMTYHDGEVAKRTWRFQKLDAHHFAGYADDVIGKADIEIAGNAMHWDYRMAVDVKGKPVTIHFDDWMYLMDDETLMNINHFKKFGLHVGTLTLTMQRASDSQSNTA